jgi:hypothetical protein
MCSSLSAQVADLADIAATKKAFKPSFNSGDAALDIKEGAIVYSVETPSEKDFRYLQFQPARLRASQDFTITGTFKNDAIPEASRELASIGIEVYQATDLSNRVAATLSVARLQGFFSRTVFSQIVEGGESVASTYSDELRVPIETTFKLSFDSEDKVFSVHYDTDEGEAVAWELVGTFGIGGSGGEDGNANWRMRSTEKFLVYVYGYSENLQIFEGDVEVSALSVEVNP